MQDWHEPAEKRARVTSQNLAAIPEAAASDIDPDNTHSIEYWIETIPEPEYSFDRGFKMSQNQLAKKRSSSAMSYSQGVREGIYPTAHTSDYEKRILNPAGIYLAQQRGEAAIGQSGKKLCKDLLSATYDPPPYSLFEGELFWKTLESVRNENEARIVRDVQPNIIPSPEILSLRGLSKIKYLKEAIVTQWSNVVSFAGPQPCPDFTVGLSPSAFTSAEIDQLNRQSIDAPSRFIGDLYFPFFTCEAKCGANGLNESDRQNARSAATAIHAILQLHRQGDQTRQESKAPTGANQLYREPLFFSISHDHSFVKIYSYYPVIKEDKTNNYCHLIKSYDLNEGDGENRWTAYNFFRKLCDDFAPIHLQRIRDAIPYLPEPKPESFVSTTSVETATDMPNSQEIAASASSQNTAAFKKPRLPPKSQQLSSNANEAKLQEENDALKAQVNVLITQMQTSNTVITQLQRQGANSEDGSRMTATSVREQRMEDELERQREELERLKHGANTGNDSEAMTMLRQELERQRQDSERQREQLEQQRLEISKLTAALMQSLPAQPKQRGKK